MKKCKKFLAFMLALSFVCALAVFPASAATGSDSFSKRVGGYGTSGSLTLTNTGASASFEAWETAGPVTADPISKIDGQVTYTDSDDKTTTATFSISGSLSCSVSTTVDGITKSAEATYTLNGTTAGTLSV